jgi:hypothetical protein
MTATIEVVREIGFPWFDQHATKGGREIFAFSHSTAGRPIDPIIRGCLWDSHGAMVAFYRANPPPDYSLIAERECPGYLDDCDFDTWEEAEAWLFAKNKDKET